MATPPRQSAELRLKDCLEESGRKPAALSRISAFGPVGDIHHRQLFGVTLVNIVPETAALIKLGWIPRGKPHAPGG